MPAFLRPSFRSLHFAARPAVVARYLGMMLGVFAALAAMPAGFALWEGSLGVVIRFGIVIAAAAIAAFAALRLAEPRELQRNEALVVSALTFILPPLLLILPLTGYGLGAVDALFEAVSGVTTTGLSAMPTVENMPDSFHFTRAWMQWIGGLGVVVLVLALLLEPSTASSQLGFDRREAPDIAGGTRSHARKVTLVYLALTFGAVLAIWLSGAGPLDSLLHGMAAVSTGGFSNYDDSLAGFGSAATPYVVTLASFSGAVSFHLYYRRRYQPLASLAGDAQFVGLLVTMALVVGLAAWLAHPAADASRLEQFGTVLLTAVSAQTTAGFAVVPPQELGQAAILVLVVAMLVGGSLGSTAGGIKIFRLLLLMRMMQLMLARTSVPHGTRLDMRLAGSRVLPIEMEAASAVVFGFLVTITVCWSAFVACGYPPLPALFDVVSAVATVGLSVGVVGQTVEPGLKLLLCVGMVMGRVETAALVVLLFPVTWMGKRRAIR